MTITCRIGAAGSISEGDVTEKRGWETCLRGAHSSVEGQSVPGPPRAARRRGHPRASAGGGEGTAWDEVVREVSRDRVLWGPENKGSTSE